MKSAGLTEISFDALIPQVKYPFARYPDGFKSADFYTNKLKELKVSKEPFQFVCSRVSPGGKLLFGNDITVSLEDYTISEDAKDGLDLTVAVKLKQYRHYGAKTVEIKKTTAQITETRPAQSAPNIKTYTVVSGDCLWNIAKKHLGNGESYPEIYELNKDKIKNPNLIYPGQVLTMP